MVCMHVYVLVFMCMSTYAKANIFGYLKTTISTYCLVFLNELLFICVCAHHMHVGDRRGAEAENNWLS